MGAEIENLNPNVYKKCAERKRTASDEDENILDPFDEREIFGKYIRRFNEYLHLLRLICNMIMTCAKTNNCDVMRMNSFNKQNILKEE